MEHEPAAQLRQDYIWNTASSIMAAASTVIMTLVVTRVSGLAAAGLFGLAMAIGQQFQTLGMYEVRTFQATDVRSRFSFGTYHSVRIVTVLLMLIGVILYPILSNEPREDLPLLILVASLRLVDAYEDVFFGELQREGRLDLAGRSFFFRVLTTTLVFCGALILTNNLWLSTVLALAVSVVALLVMVLLPSSKHFNIAPLFTFGPMRQVLIDCLPLFLAAFLSVFLVNEPRFAISTYMDKTALGYFVIIFMPAFAVNLLSTLMFRPLLTRMAVAWVRHDRVQFRGLIVRGLQGAVIGFAVVFALTYLVGIPLLSWLYGKDVSEFKPEMMVLVAGGSFNAISVILYYALTTMRRQHAIFIGYAISAAAVLALATVLVPRMGVMGAAISYVLAVLLLVAVFSIFLVGYSRASRPTDESPTAFQTH